MNVFARISWVTIAMLCSVLLAASQVSAPHKHISDGVLGQLLGTWTVTGSTLGRPTVTGAHVQEDFNGSFLEIHIEDPAKKDRYEARVFLGEKQNGDLVVHWLDGTGAEMSQTLGTVVLQMT